MPFTAPNKAAHTDKADFRRIKELTLVVAIPLAAPLRDSAAVPATIMKTGGLVCVLESFDDIPLEVINEQQLAGQGKSHITVNDGYRLSDWNLNLRANGGHVAIQAMRGRNITSAGSLGLKQTGSFTEKVALIVYGFAEDLSIKRSTVIAGVDMKVLSLGSGDDDATMAVTFSGDDVTPVDFYNGIVPGWEGYWDDATIINAVIPYTAGVAIDLGTGNDSLLTATTDLMAVDMDDTLGATDAGRYMVGMYLDGVAQDLGGVTYTQGVAGVSEATISMPFDVGLSEYLVTIYAIDTLSGANTDLITPGLREDLSNNAGQNVLGSYLQPLHNFVTGL